VLVSCLHTISYRYLLAFLFHTPAPTEIYTLSLHDALPISMDVLSSQATVAGYKAVLLAAAAAGRLFPMLVTAAGTLRRRAAPPRSEEHTSELQSRGHLVCRLLLEKKKRAISHLHQYY